MTSLRLVSTLPPDLEDLVQRTIGALLDVHRELGSGMSEAVYAVAVRLELEARGIPFESEKTVPVRYKGHLIGHHRIDLLVDRRLVVEIKSVECIHSVHVAQVVSYLRVTGSQIGLLVNFNVPLLKQGIRRVIR
jgi:GxxExxY protein